MDSEGSYVPPHYIPLGRSDSEEEFVPKNKDLCARPTVNDNSSPWSSGICACCDDMHSCCIGTFFPCFLFGKNAESLGSGSLSGSCTTHFILWGLLGTLCCVLTDGLLLGLPACFVACYSYRFRKALRSKYNLQEAPCGDFVTHLCCHACANCQEYREIRERSGPAVDRASVTAPSVQRMESVSRSNVSS